MSRIHLFFAMTILLGCGFYFVGYILHTVALNVNFNTKLKPNCSDGSCMRNKKVKNDTSNILILTSGRAGSSFLGEIFKRNDRKTRYVFEPLRKILQNVFIADHLKFKAINIISESFRYRNTSNSDQTDQNVVVKELSMRFPQNGSSSVLENLMRYSKSWNMRIIHLVRDPRHVIPSMQRLRWFGGNATSLEQQIRSVCETIWSNIKYGRKRNYALIKDHYKLVVFRNMMIHPYKTAEALYEFAGMGSVPASVPAWIKFSTNGIGNYEGSLSYKTTRNTTKVLSRKIAMSEETSNFVHKHCCNIISFIQEFQEMENI